MNDNELLSLLIGGTSQFDFEEKPRICGVYFLLSEGRVIYIGQTIDMHTRLWQHKSQRKRIFDRALFLECDRDMLDEVEARCIALFKPTSNDPRHVVLYAKRYPMSTNSHSLATTPQI
jgi:hypothetical protein